MRDKKSIMSSFLETHYDFFGHIFSNNQFKYFIFNIVISSLTNGYLIYWKYIILNVI